MIPLSRESVVIITASLLFALFTQAPGLALAQSTNHDNDDRNIQNGQPATPDDEFGDRFGGYAGGVAAPAQPQIPPGLDVFNLTLEQTRAFSLSKNFEVVGHSYFKGPWLTPFAQQHGLGAGFNTPRVYDGIAYLGATTARRFFSAC